MVGRIFRIETEQIHVREITVVPLANTDCLLNESLEAGLGQTHPAGCLSYIDGVIVLW